MQLFAKFKKIFFFLKVLETVSSHLNEKSFHESSFINKAGAALVRTITSTNEITNISCCKAMNTFKSQK